MSIIVMKQALEALTQEKWFLIGLGEPNDPKVEAAITALRTAIAEAEKQEPVAWAVFEGRNAHDLYLPQEYDAALKMAGYKGDHAEVKPLYTTPPAAQSAPVQEPVIPKIKSMLQPDAYLQNGMLNPKYTTPPAQPAPVQEPVAWAKEYAAINEFYGKQTADRSGLSLMRHIDDGLHILTLNGASDTAKAAFCLHPLIQNSEVVDVSWSPAYSLACEYRDKANAYLCRPDTDWVSSVDDVQSIVGEMTDDCRAMLIADKRQNYGDFIAAHYGKHSRSKELDRYFRLWIAYLEDTTPPAQRQWVGLTDEEIEQEFGFIDELLRDHVYRTQAKLKQKNIG